MKVSDYVFDFLARRGVKNVFYLPGGGCMHLLDSLAANKKINSISLLHEQAVAIAAEADANTRGDISAALVTTGPGATNTITGMLAAYLDSSPCFFISGQVKTADLKSNFGVRSHGSQEADIVTIAASITKYAVMVTDKNSIRYHLEKAWHEALNGRRGPVLLDIPLDVQGAQIEPDLLKGYEPKNIKTIINIDKIISMLNNSCRPLIIAGNGLASCKNLFYEFLTLLNIPVIPSWKAMDYIENSHPLYAGRAGGMGDRAGNLAMQNADLILSLGCRLDFSITGFERGEWAVKAQKIIIDIDENEIKKLVQAKNIHPVIAPAKDVIKELLSQKNKINIKDLTEWKNYILNCKKKYPIQTNTENLTTYSFIAALCDLLTEGAYIAPCSSGTTAEIFFQAFNVKRGQIIRSNHGLGSMGFELPNAIGMCIASGMREVVCIAGDGGMQLNIQELAVIRARNLPIKIFAINNSGYASIRNMQNNHFEGRHIGCDAQSGLFLPSLEKISAAYEIKYYSIKKNDELKEVIQAALKEKCPALCEVFVTGDCLVQPRSSTIVMQDGTMRSSPLENQFPFLSEDELKNLMLN